jgi:putative Holliday junction resolvase
MGVDLGERRIGIALSDSGGVLATPYTVLERTGDGERDRANLGRLVEETRAEIVVVGLPVSLSGSFGPAARAAASEIEALGLALHVPVVSFDERLTTVEAARRRRERAGGPPSRPRSAGRSARRPIDAEAAAVMLEAWLGERRGGPHD